MGRKERSGMIEKDGALAKEERIRAAAAIWVYRRIEFLESDDPAMWALVDTFDARTSEVALMECDLLGSDYPHVRERAEQIEADLRDGRTDHDALRQEIRRFRERDVVSLAERCGLQRWVLYPACDPEPRARACTNYAEGERVWAYAPMLREMFVEPLRPDAGGWFPAEVAEVEEDGGLVLAIYTYGGDIDEEYYTATMQVPAEGVDQSVRREPPTVAS